MGGGGEERRAGQQLDLGEAPGALGRPSPPPPTIPLASLLSLLACELKTKTKRQQNVNVISLSHFSLLWSVLSCLPVCPRVSLSAEPPPAKTDSDLEADARAAAG